MLQLFILRHGKAVKPMESVSDFNRNLSKKGIAQINQVGYILKNSPLNIAQIISSSAQRTTETAEIMHFYLETGKINFDEKLYLTDSQNIKHLICQKANSKSILLVGHNFGISNLVNELIGDNMLLSTGMLVQINFNFDDWNLIHTETGTIEQIIEPQVHTF